MRELRSGPSSTTGPHVPLSEASVSLSIKGGWGEMSLPQSPDTEGEDLWKFRTLGTSLALPTS